MKKIVVCLPLILLLSGCQLSKDISQEVHSDIQGELDSTIQDEVKSVVDKEMSGVEEEVGSVGREAGKIVEKAIEEAKLPDIPLKDHTLGKIDTASVIELQADEADYQLETPFTGTIYIMENRKQIEDKVAEKTTDTLNQTEFDRVQNLSAEDFNILYKNKTYFSVKKIQVTDLSQMTLNSTGSDPLVLVFKPHHS